MQQSQQPCWNPKLVLSRDRLYKRGVLQSNAVKCCQVISCYEHKQISGVCISVCIVNWVVWHRSGRGRDSFGDTAPLLMLPDTW